MAKISVNIESSKSALTLEQKIAIQKQNKFCQWTLNAYAKDKKKKIEKEFDRLAKLEIDYLNTNTPQPTEKAPKKAKIQPKEKVRKISIEILRHLFEKNRMSLLPLYMHVTREIQYSGIMQKKDVAKIAGSLKRNPNTIMLQLSQLVNLGLCERKKDVWLFTGVQRFTISCGKVRVKMVKVERLERSYLTTLAYSVFVTEQGKRIITKAIKDNPSINVDGINVQISCGYTGNWIERSKQTVSCRRKAANELGLLAYKRTFRIVQKGGQEVRGSFKAARSNGNTEKNEFLSEKNGIFSWYAELPSSFSSFTPISSYSIKSKVRVKVAQEMFRLLKAKS